MHKDTTKEFAGIAVQKIDYFKRNPLGYFISTMMAGAYFMLRKGKENIDAKEIAAVFD